MSRAVAVQPFWRVKIDGLATALGRISTHGTSMGVMSDGTLPFIACGCARNTSPFCGASRCSKVAVLLCQDFVSIPSTVRHGLTSPSPHCLVRKRSTLLGAESTKVLGARQLCSRTAPHAPPRWSPQQHVPVSPEHRTRLTVSPSTWAGLGNHNVACNR
jgi:hypothetical protein